MRYRLFVPIAILVAIMVTLWVASRQPRTIIVPLGTEHYVLEVANTPESRDKGLGGRETLKPGTGMLFAFNEPGRYRFWMKDMLIPIDIVWLDGDWCVVDMVRNLTPESFPQAFGPDVEALYAVEINAGDVDKLGLAPGQCFRVPVL